MKKGANFMLKILLENNTFLTGNEVNENHSGIIIIKIGECLPYSLMTRKGDNFFSSTHIHLMLPHPRCNYNSLIPADKFFISSIIKYF